MNLFGFDSENYLFYRLHNECNHDLPHLISRRLFSARRKKLCRFTEEINWLNDVQYEYSDCLIFRDKGYLSKEIQLRLFETVNISLEVPYRLNQKNYRKPIRTYKKFRKRIETVFSQFDDILTMIRIYAKHSIGLFTKISGKIAAMIFMRDVNYLNHQPLGKVKYKYALN